MTEHLRIGVVICTLQTVYPKLLDVGCFSHTLDRVGEYFNIPILSEFTSTWIMMFSCNPKVRLLWKEQTGRAMGSYSATRLWSRWEIMKQLMVQYPEIEMFLKNNPDVAPASHAKLITFFQDKQKNAYLQLELAAIVDWGEHFVKATYNLEGDGPLVFQCYEMVDSLTTAIRLSHTPNVTTIAQRLAAQVRGVTTHQLQAYASNCIKPGLEYFNHQLETSLKVPLEAFKAARLFYPPKAYTMQPSVGDVDNLSCIPFIDAEIIKLLKTELPVYLAKCADTGENFCALKWWKMNSQQLPTWAASAKKVLLVQPSSAASERVFSLLKASFNDQQDFTLQDYLEASLMLQYNNFTHLCMCNGY